MLKQRSLINQSDIDDILEKEITIFNNDLNHDEVIKPIKLLQKMNGLEVMLLEDFPRRYPDVIDIILSNSNDNKGDWKGEIAIWLASKCKIYPKNEEGVDNSYINDILEDYFNKNKQKHSILIAVDTSGANDYLPKKYKGKKVSSKRKKKYKKRYSYENPMNRIHGFLILQHDVCPCRTKDRMKMISMTVVCANHFASASGMKAIGAFLIGLFLFIAKEMKNNKAILEVANNYAADDGIDDFDDDDDDDDDEFSNLGFEYLFSKSELQRMTVPELKDELIRMTLPRTGNKSKLVSRILEAQEDTEFGVLKKMGEFPYTPDSIDDEVDCSNPISFGIDDDIYGYGGINYTNGKQDAKKLYCFYERIGFRESGKLNTDWKCFDNEPFPAMWLDLQKMSFECLGDALLNMSWTKEPSGYCMDRQAIKYPYTVSESCLHK